MTGVFKEWAYPQFNPGRDESIMLTAIRKPTLTRGRYAYHFEHAQSLGDAGQKHSKDMLCHPPVLHPSYSGNI